MGWSRSIRLPIYLDHNATTPLDPRVKEQMRPYLEERFGNPSSQHGPGKRARTGVERARGQVAALLGVDADEVIFTSGATESNNLALAGLLGSRAEPSGRGALVTTVIEHPSVRDPARRLARAGVDLSVLPVGPDGRVDPSDVARAVAAGGVGLVSVMLAHNEIGTIQPVAEIAEICQRAGVLLHCDATQAVGKIAVDLRRLGVDLASLSAHKMYGPKGIGALYVRRGLQLEPLIDGGGQQRGMRSGTLDAPGIVGFGAAAELARRCLDEESRRLARQRERIWQRLQRELDDVVLNGSPTERVPGNLHISIAGVETAALLSALQPVVSASGAAACAADGPPSGVLHAIGRKSGGASLRLGLGRFSTDVELELAVDEIISSVRLLRA